jgi:hypothetical protein
MGVRPDAPTIQTIVPVTFYEFIMITYSPFSDLYKLEFDHIDLGTS